MDTWTPLMQEDPKQESVFLSLLDTTAARVVGVVMAVVAFYSAVIIPLGKIQVQLADIEAQLVDNKATLTAINQKDTQQDQEIQRNTLLINQLTGDKNN